MSFVNAYAQQAAVLSDVTSCKANWQWAHQGNGLNQLPLDLCFALHELFVDSIQPVQLSLQAVLANLRIVQGGPVSRSQRCMHLCMNGGCHALLPR